MLRGVDGVKDERGGIDVGHQRDAVEDGSERTRVGRIGHDDELALGIAAVDFAALQFEDRRLHLDEALRPGLHQDAGDFPAGLRDHAIRLSRRPVIRARRSTAV